MSILNNVHEELDGSKLYGHYVLAHCMFHDDTSPSLLIYEDTYRCKSCDAHGSTSKLLSQLRNDQISAPIVVDAKDRHNPFTRWIARFGGLYELVEVAYHTIRRNDGLGHYLYSRSIPKSVVRELRIGYIEGWYIIPVYDRRKALVGAVARCGSASQNRMRYTLPTGQDPNLLYCPSWDRANKSDTVFLTFGPIDIISIHVAGGAGFSTLSGKQLNPKALDDIRKPIKVFSDKWEEQEAQKLAGNLGWRGNVVRYSYDNGCADPNDVLRKRKLKDVINKEVLGG